MGQRLSMWIILLSTVLLVSCAACSQKSSEVVVSATPDAPATAAPSPPPPAAAPAPILRPMPRVPPKRSSEYEGMVSEGGGSTGSRPRPPAAAGEILTPTAPVRPPIKIKPGVTITTPSASAGVNDSSAATAINSWPFASQLSKADIAFNTPDKMTMGETADMQLIIDPSKTSEEIKKEITAEGTKLGATVLISKIVIAKVIAPNFDVVELVNKGRQAIDFSGPTEWKWTISPKSKGSHKIHLTITAVIQIDGDKAERLIKTFDREVTVLVTPKQVIVSFFEKYWQWLFTTLLLPLGLWLWKGRNKKE